MVTNIRKGRSEYRPFYYPEIREIGRQQRSAFWLETNINMSKDVSDWKQKLTEEEKSLIGNVLKGFTQMEVLVGDYWRKVADWFPHPEIAAAASTMSFFETIHQEAYDLLNATLDFNDYEGFIQEETIKNKMEMLMEVKNEDDYDILSSLAIFSAFTEGVSIFSSFAILLSFQTRDLLNGVGKIVAYSVRDESLHSKLGVKIFNIFKDELEKADPAFKERFEQVKSKIFDAAQLVVELESSYIDMCFEKGNIMVREPRTGKEYLLTPEHIKTFIKARTNSKMRELGLEPVYAFAEKENFYIGQMQWFNVISGGKEFQDFFAATPTAYSHGWDFSALTNKHNW